MSNIFERVQVNMPFRMMVDHYLTLVIEERINPEIGFDCCALDRFSEKEFRDVASRLNDAGVSITFHAPFFDLRPGALDRRIREVTRDRLQQVFDLAHWFRPATIVCHASFDRNYYVDSEEQWLENSRDTWSHFIPLAEELNTVIALENVYEHDPSMLSRLLHSFEGTEHVRMCFDTGHCNTFSTVMLDEWLGEIGSFIGEVHLHDNDGGGDHHEPVGEGTFPFHRLFHYLKESGIRPVITLEPHTEEHMRRTVDNIKRLELLELLE